MVGSSGGSSGYLDGGFERPLGARPTWKLRAATPWAAAAGAAIVASLTFSTVTVPYEPWHSALVPVLAVAVLAFISTRLGREQKERLGTAEKRHGNDTPPR